MKSFKRFSAHIKDATTRRADLDRFVEEVAKHCKHYERVKVTADIVATKDRFTPLDIKKVYFNGKSVSFTRMFKSHLNTAPNSFCVKDSITSTLWGEKRTVDLLVCFETDAVDGAATDVEYKLSGVKIKYPPEILGQAKQPGWRFYPWPMKSWFPNHIISH